MKKFLSTMKTINSQGQATEQFEPASCSNTEHLFLWHL